MKYVIFASHELIGTLIFTIYQLLKETNVVYISIKLELYTSKCCHSKRMKWFLY